MALLLSNIRMPVSADIQDIPALIASSFDIPRACVQAVRLVRQSLDARKKEDIHFRAAVVVQLEPIWQARLMKRNAPGVALHVPPESYTLPTGSAKAQGRIVVAGLGPAGLFAAYFLAQAGYAPLVIERGQPVEQRAADVEAFWNGKGLHPQSNVMFGEGGAGTFSDGKLTTRSKDSRVDTVLKTLVEHGAPEDIAYLAKPHIGTDILQSVVKNMREAIVYAGGEIQYGTTLCGLQLEDGRLSAVQVETDGKQTRIPCAACILATGQAARDTYEMLHETGLELVAKPFAVGVRIEHPQAWVDQSQFGALAGHPRLGAAEYRLAAKCGAPGNTRGVYTFCMCPGGEVIPAASGPEETVVNGMSLRARNGMLANAAIVVQVHPEDFGQDTMAGIRFQKELERKAFFAGGCTGVAPAQRLEDFMQGDRPRPFGDIRPSYRLGVVPYRLDTLLPAFVAEGIKEGIRAFDRQIKGFAMPDAVLTALESRTSAPVRIARDETMQATRAENLYPAGEGAGYAGGIVSAAVDGMRAAERIAARFRPGAEK